MKYVIFEKASVVAMDIRQAILDVTPDADVRTVGGVAEFHEALKEMGREVAAIVSAPLGLIQSEGLWSSVQERNGQFVWLRSEAHDPTHDALSWTILPQPLSSDALVQLIIKTRDGQL